MLAGCGLDAAVSASGHPFSANDRYGGRKLPIGFGVSPGIALDCPFPVDPVSTVAAPQ